MAEPVRQLQQLEKARPHERFPVQHVVDGVHAALGNISVTAQRLGCHRSTIQRYADRHPAVAQAIAEERLALVDHAESALRAAVLAREGWAVCFTLKTLGKERGYVERHEHEVTGAAGGPLRFTLTLDRPGLEAGDDGGR